MDHVYIHTEWGMRDLTAKMKTTILLDENYQVQAMGRSAMETLSLFLLLSYLYKYRIQQSLKLAPLQVLKASQDEGQMAVV